MEKHVNTLILSKYGDSDIVINDLGGGYYGRVFLVELNQYPFQVIIKFYLKDNLYISEKLQLDELRKCSTLKVPVIYSIHEKNEGIPYDALLMEYIKGENAGTIDLEIANKAIIANQIVDNLITIHNSVHNEGFGEIAGTKFYGDWRYYYKPIAKSILDKAEFLFDKGLINNVCIETVRIAYQRFDEIFYLPITKASLIHGDYNTWNIMVDYNAINAIAMIDPYNCCYGDSEFDLYQLDNANGKEYGLFDLYKSKCTLSQNWRVKKSFYELFAELMHYYDSGVVPDMNYLGPKVEQLQNQMIKINLVGMST